MVMFNNRLMPSHCLFALLALQIIYIIWFIWIFCLNWVLIVVYNYICVTICLGNVGEEVIVSDENSNLIYVSLVIIIISKL